MIHSSPSVRIKFLPLIALLPFLALKGFAQANGSGGSIGISFQTLPNRNFKDTTGKFGYTNLGINLSVPLFGNRNKIKEGIAAGGSMPAHFYQVSLHTNFESLPYTIGFIGNDHHFYTGSAGVGLLFGSKKNIFIVNAGTGMAADEQVIKNNDLRYRFSGSFLVNNRHSSTTTYIYGVAFTYAYGKGLPLPVLGIHKRFSETSNWSIRGILPLSVTVTDRVNQSASFSFYVKPAGNLFQIVNDGHIPTTSSFASMQVRQFQFGLSYNHKLGEHFSLSADAGMLFGGKLKFTEYSDRKIVLSQASIKPGPSLKVGIRYRFTKKSDKRNDDEIGGGMF